MKLLVQLLRHALAAIAIGAAGAIIVLSLTSHARQPVLQLEPGQSTRLLV